MLLRKKQSINLKSIEDVIKSQGSSFREEFSQNRKEANSNAKELREELNSSFIKLNESVLTRLTENLTLQKNQFDTFSKQLSKLTETNEIRLDKMRETIDQKMNEFGDKSNTNTKNLREEMNQSFSSFRETLAKQTQDNINMQRDKLKEFADKLSSFIELYEEKSQSLRKAVEDKLVIIQEENSKKIDKMREENNINLKENRTELENTLKQFKDAFIDQIQEIDKLQKSKLETISVALDKLTSTNEEKIEKLRESVENKLQSIQEDNSRKLDKMRQTVDEKLQSTLEKRLGESFNVVSKQLEQVYRGIGEMRKMASDVGDLKKVLSNVKTRGNLGEIQLGNILEEILTPEQYETNVKTKMRSDERIEFAIRLPGRDDDRKAVLLPIDSKFPIESYHRLLDAYETANPEIIMNSRKELIANIRKSAKDISKYINPPVTTDFALMFLPTEGLYSEVLRITGLFEELQYKYHISITGPTTLAAFLSSLQMGFRTLAVQKRSSEVWKLLSAIKTNFKKFDSILIRTQKKLHEASNVIDEASKRTQIINRKLNKVEELPIEESQLLLEDKET